MAPTFCIIIPNEFSLRSKDLDAALFFVPLDRIYPWSQFCTLCDMAAILGLRPGFFLGRTGSMEDYLGIVGLIRSEARKMKTKDIEQVLKSRYGKFAEKGGYKEPC